MLGPLVVIEISVQLQPLPSHGFAVPSQNQSNGINIKASAHDDWHIQASRGRCTLQLDTHDRGASVRGMCTTQSATEDENKLAKPYKRFHSQGHEKKWSTVVASLMLAACLVVKI